MYTDIVGIFEKTNLLFNMKAKSEDALTGVVLEAKLEERLRDIAISTKNTKQNKYSTFSFNNLSFV